MRPLSPEDEEWLTDFVNRIDEAIITYEDKGNHNLAGALLSRVVLLMTHQPDVGKDLVKYVWEKLDEIEQADPNNFL